MKIVVVSLQNNLHLVCACGIPNNIYTETGCYTGIKIEKKLPKKGSENAGNDTSQAFPCCFVVYVMGTTSALSESIQILSPN